MTDAMAPRWTVVALLAGLHGVAVAEPDSSMRSEAEATPPAPTVNEAGLPLPPSQEPRAYAAWLRAQPRKVRRAIDRHCRAHPREQDDVCGGIGPLHIPMPPATVPIKGSPPSPVTRDAWLASLSAAQRRYVRQHCVTEEEQFTDLCGATPLVLVFDQQPIAYRAGGRFAFLPGDPQASDWPTAATPWLARDLDGDGAITSGAELLGGNTVLSAGRAARHGFEALAALDLDGDGRVGPADPAYATLLVWADADGDRRSTPDELRPLAGLVPWLPVAHQVAPRCDDRGNCERERATVRWTDTAGDHRVDVVDVHLRLR